VVPLEDHEPFVERILHKLVRKHIAGTTMDSALEAAKELNKMNVPASITFLSGNVLDKSKAKYNATAYAELVRRIARSGIKSSIHVLLEELGSDVDEQVALDNMQMVADAGSKYGVFLWVEPDGMSKAMVLKIGKMKGVGIAINVLKIDDYIKGNNKFNSFKLSFKDYDIDDAKETSKMLADIKKNAENVTVSSMNENLLWKVIASKQKDIVFEFGYGYSNHKMKRAIKKGAKICVLVPFGKDWIKYAMNNVPEGYMRFVAGKLLKEEVI
jgi:proline dehydrogenase